MSVHAIDRKMAAAGDESINPDVVLYDFAAFWKAYPRRVARKDAEKAWQLVKTQEYPKIFAALETQKKSHDWKKDGGQFVPYPASWIRGERWNDELDTDHSMGECCWNRNGSRGPEGKCTQPAVTEKQGIAYCREHAARVG